MLVRVFLILCVSVFVVFEISTDRHEHRVATDMSLMDMAADALRG
jgi:hypothetical protein